MQQRRSRADDDKSFCGAWLHAGCSSSSEMTALCGARSSHPLCARHCPSLPVTAAPPPGSQVERKRRSFCAVIDNAPLPPGIRVQSARPAPGTGTQGDTATDTQRDGQRTYRDMQRADRETIQSICTHRRRRETTDYIQRDGQF